MIEAWTEDEDFYLSQGFAMYHDEKNDIWTKIRNQFPFKESRKPNELQERWRLLSEQLEAEDQGTLERIKSSSKLNPQTWKYNYEPTIIVPEENEVIDQFKNLPSLAMKTQFTETQNTRFTNDLQNINEMCLNFQFDAGSIRRIVNEVLTKTVDDETLKKTLMTEFQGVIAQKGREFAYEDIERKIDIINNKMSQQDAENEVIILSDYFDRVFQGMINRITVTPNVTNLKEVIDILTTLYGKVRIPQNAVPVVIQFYREFFSKYMATFAKIFNSQIFLANIAQFKQSMDNIMKIDRGHEIDKNLAPNLKQYFAKYRQQFEEQPMY